jgi:hypothetical protein
MPGGPPIAAAPLLPLFDAPAIAEAPNAIAASAATPAAAFRIVCDIPGPFRRGLTPATLPPASGPPV